MAQTAEGALTNISDMLGRLKDLAAQGASDALNGTQRNYITKEMAQIRSEINAIANRTSFNGLSLLTGDFSQAVKGEFKDTISAVTPQNKSVLRESDLNVGDASEVSNDNTRSRFSIADIQVDSAQEGTYSLANNNSSLVLTRDINGVKTQQSVRLVMDPNAARAGDAVVSSADGGTFTVNFDELGVQINIKNERIGSADRNAREIATKIAAIGLQPDESLKTAGWTAVSGADIADDTKFAARFAGQSLKAIITSSEQIRVSDTSQGTSSVTGYSGQYTGALNATTSRYEMAFSGTEDQLNATLRSLETNSLDGKGDIRVEILPQDISVFVNPTTGVTSYYEVVRGPKAGATNGETINWTDARADALSRTFSGMQGYLATVTSSDENTFIFDKINADSWIGGTDNSLIINTLPNSSTSYTTQDDSNNSWFWVDGPEAGQAVTWFNWAGGQPDDAAPGGGIPGREYYLQLRSSAGVAGRWNDLPNTAYTNGSWPIVTSYVIEYGGTADSFTDTSKTLLVGKPGSFEVGDGLVLRDVELTGINTQARMSQTADIGIYKLSANAADRTVTLSRYDMDDETLLGSETISHNPLVAATGWADLVFNKLGVSVSLENVSDRTITMGEGESGVSSVVQITSSKTTSLIGKDGPMFQTGHSAYSDFATQLFKDTRMGKNTDSQDKTLFNQVGSMITDLAAQGENASNNAFNDLYNKLGELIDTVSARRSNLGTMQNRLQSSINNVNEQTINLEAAQGQIMNTDYAAETARMTRMQIGQQAATAMLAQANQLPNVILALLQ
jgi:flagellin-like hook-associated protein FlgL